MTKNTYIILGVMLAIVVLAGIFTYVVIQRDNNSINEETKEIFASETTEGFAYTDIKGNDTSLEQYLGRILVVTSWASWSPFSKDGLTSLDSLASKYSVDEIIFLAVNRKETKEMAERYMNTLPSLDNLLIILDPTDHFYTAVAGYAMPETVIFDTRGDIILHIKGVVKVADIEAELEILLNKDS
jgi:thiol-disulfide isomerase/thioredoxin